jgi:hypothetical protein
MYTYIERVPYYECNFFILQRWFRNAKAFEKTIEFFHDVYWETSQLQPPPHPQTNIWRFSWKKSICEASPSHLSIRTSFVITATATEHARKSRISICIMNCGHWVLWEPLHLIIFTVNTTKYIVNTSLAPTFYGMAAIFRYFVIFVVRCVRCTCGSAQLCRLRKKILHFNTPVLTVPGVIRYVQTLSGISGFRWDSVTTQISISFWNKSDSSATTARIDCFYFSPNCICEWTWTLEQQKWKFYSILFLAAFPYPIGTNAESIINNHGTGR